jgi:hypothetical protein
MFRLSVTLYVPVKCYFICSVKCYFEDVEDICSGLTINTNFQQEFDRPRHLLLIGFCNK